MTHEKPDWVIEMDAVGGPCWVTTGGGDPERTHNFDMAERYVTEAEARENAAAFRRKYPHRTFRAVPVTPDAELKRGATAPTNASGA